MVKLLKGIIESQFVFTKLSNEHQKLVNESMNLSPLSSYMTNLPNLSNKSDLLN